MGSVTLKNINKSFGSVSACADVNLAIQEGEFFTFLGPSGCGKTTTLRIIAGFVDADSGQVQIGNQIVNNTPAEERQVGLVFQNYALFPFMTVFENVAYSLKIKKLPASEIASKVGQYLEMVQLKGYGKRQISELSGGEQQRVALARSLAMEPKVLLLDEPLSNLDAKLRVSMRQEIKSIIKKLGITTIFVTHDQTEALALSDRIAVFNHGKCIQVGTPEEIYNQPSNTFVAEFIGEINIWPIQLNKNTMSISDNIHLDVGQNKTGNYICIRPQEIELSKDKVNKPNTFEGKVINSQLTGLFYDYDIAVKDKVFKVSRPNTMHKNLEIHVGDSINLSLDPKSIKLLSD
jgi:ABC-type Fe3+/spermidine/putrescine transport system ATPase subunit